MASKKSAKNTQGNSSVAERRLRPIYDWLDNSNNKKALQEADKVLKKQPDFVCCKALKALALVRLGREEEASPILDSILQRGTCDEGALQAMNVALREMQQPSMICTMYEKATLLDPTNEELLSQLFMAYVRIGAYKKQQNTALALYKVKAKTPYYFWAVMSVVLQAKEASADEEKTVQKIMLPLAERMISKMEKEGKMEQEQETRLYLMVLEMQQKYKEALQVLQGSLGQKLASTTSFMNFVANAKLMYQKKLDHWDQVNVLAKDILQKCPDQWDVYLDYITSTFRLVDSQTNSSGWSEEVDATVGDAINFIAFQREHNAKCRGPFLAQIELHSRLLARRAEDVKMAELTDLLVKYFEKFGDKPCCANDLKLYLPTLDGNEADKFLQEAFKTINFNAEIPATESDVNRHISWHSLNRLVGKHDSLQALVLLETHQLCCQHYTNYSSTVVKPHDGYLVLACHIYWDLWQESKEDKYMWSAVVPLYDAIHDSPASFQLKLLLVKFLNAVGAVGLSYKIHAGLELKHVQWDSLGYVLSRHIQTCGHFDTSLGLYHLILKFFNSSYKEIIDFLISAYRFGSFDKLIEFINLRRRLSSSQQYASLNVEQVLLKLIWETSDHAQAADLLAAHQIDPEKDDISWSDLTDNRDFKVMTSWDSTDKSVTDDLISESFVQDQRFLKYRSLILRSIAASLNLLNAKNIVNGGEEATNQAENVILESLISQLQEHHDQVLKEEVNYKALDSPIQGPYRSRLSLYVKHGQLMIAMFRGVSSLHQHHGHNLDEMSKAGQVYFSAVQEVLKKAKPTQLVREDFFEDILNTIESGSILCLLCSVCQRIIDPWPSSKKSKKNPASNDKMQALNQLVVQLLNQFNSLGTFLRECQESIKLDDSNVTAAMDALKLNDKRSSKKSEELLSQGILESYHQTFDNLAQMIKSKTKFLKTLNS